MRVIAGISKGKKLKSARDGRVRPTSDRIRTVLFDMLSDLIIGARFLDLCAGTGSVGIEALSRGAKEAVFVELDVRCVETIKANLLITKLFDRAKVIRGDARRKLSRLLAFGERFDLIFLDPPYGTDLAHQILSWIGDHPDILQGARLVIVQQRARETLPEGIGVLKRFEDRRVGEHVLRFYSPGEG